MKGILLIAPGAYAPWTEGRKNLVRDLQRGLSKRGFTATVVSGEAASAKQASSMILAMASCFRQLLRATAADSKLPILLFPFGRFTGLRGVANLAFCRIVLLYASLKRRKVSTVIYSCSGVSLDEAAALLGGKRTFAVGSGTTKVVPIRLGTHPPYPSWRAQGHEPKRLLFMSGYQANSRDALDGILNERGLGDLLRAGNALAAEGFSLTIAVPLLRHDQMRNHLERFIAATCPNLPVTFAANTEWRVAMAEHDVFVFPYRDPHGCFVPTSVLEAMLTGIPVIISDHGMFRWLCTVGEKPSVEYFEPGSVDGLVEAARHIKQAWDEAVSRSAEARERVRETWTIDGCLDDLGLH